MRRIAYLVFISILVLLGLAFTLLNVSTVTLEFYIGQIRMPLAVLVILAVLVGTLLGILVSTVLVYRYRSENRTLRKKVTLAEKEILNLRNIPIKSPH